MKKGQALVEFIIILPIFLMLVLGITDMGKILYTKISLEGKMSEVVTLYDSNKSVEDISMSLKLDKNKVDLEILEETHEINFSLQKDIDIITPGLNLIFKNPYKLKINRSILK